MNNNQKIILLIVFVFLLFGLEILAIPECKDQPDWNRESCLRDFSYSDDMSGVAEGICQYTILSGTAASCPKDVTEDVIDWTDTPNCLPSPDTWNGLCYMKYTCIDVEIPIGQEEKCHDEGEGACKICRRAEDCAFPPPGNIGYGETSLNIDFSPPESSLKRILYSSGEEVDISKGWFRPDTYTFEIVDRDLGSGIKGGFCKYGIKLTGGDFVIPQDSQRDCGTDENPSIITISMGSGKDLNLEGAGKYMLVLTATDNVDLTGTLYEGLNTDFTPPETRIE